MLLFSEYLRELLHAKKMTVSALSRLTGVERTTLSKTLTGQRVLPYDVLGELVYHLRLTPSEEQRFRAYYDAQFEKEGTRRSLETVGRLFADLAELEFAAPAFEETRLLISLETYAGQRSIFSGATNVHLAALALTEELSRRMPGGADCCRRPRLLADELLRRYLDGRMTAEVSQIIAFDPSGDGEDINLHNLECFCRIFPICLLSKRHYHPYYYYDSGVTARYTDPFPYFLATHTCVICLAEDGGQAMLLRGADQVERYHRHFQALLSQCYGLIQYTADPIEILASYDNYTDENGFYMVMDQPCFGRFYDEAVIHRYLRQQLPFFRAPERSGPGAFWQTAHGKAVLHLVYPQRAGALCRQRGAGRFSHCFCGALSARAAAQADDGIGRADPQRKCHRTGDGARRSLPRLSEHDHIRGLRRGIFYN